MILTVEVKANARETKVIAWKDAQTVIIAIKAVPIEGKANRELINFLSKRLKVAKTLIEIKRGQGARVKHLSFPEGTSFDNLQ